jgi:hypothetical protein
MTMIGTPDPNWRDYDRIEALTRVPVISVAVDDQAYWLHEDEDGDLDWALNKDVAAWCDANFKSPWYFEKCGGGTVHCHLQEDADALRATQWAKK